MSGIGEITNNNGNCLTCDSNIASVDTSEKYFKLILDMMRQRPEYADKVSAIDSSGIECTALPIRLRDLSQIKSNAVLDRQDHASKRADHESRIYAAGYYNPNDPENSLFYKNHMPSYTEEVKKRFKDTEGHGVMVVSQVTFARLFPVMVNLLMKKKPDGTDNIVRQRKAKPNSEVVNEDGSVSREYYTLEEIEEAEMKLRKEKNAENFYSLDVEYVPFSMSDFIISAASSMTVFKKADFYDKSMFPEVEEIFSLDPEENNDPLMVQHYEYLMKIANRDMALLDILEKRGGKIEELIHLDCSGVEKKKSNNENSLSMKEIYITLLIYIRFLHTFAFEFIKTINFYSNHTDLGKSFISSILGVTLNDQNSPVSQFEEIITSNEAKDYFKSSAIAFQIPDHMLRVLLISIVRLFSGSSLTALDENNSSIGKLLEGVSNFFGYKSLTHITSDVFDNFFLIEGAPTAIVDTKSFIGTLENRYEPINSYMYRTAPKYMDDEGKFTMAIGIINSSVRYIENNRNSFRYDILNSNFIFSNESLINTVKHLTNFNNLNDTMYPFVSYKNEIMKKINTLTEERIAISNEISLTYGPCSLQYYMTLPPIPYSDSELAWFKRKCIELNVHLNELQQRNPGYDWELVHNVFVNLTEMQIKNAKSDVENPLLIESIQEFDMRLKSLLKNSGLDSSEVEQLLSLESKLLSYSKPETMEFGYEPFEFKFNKDVDLTMNYHLDKSSILINGHVRSCKSLMNDSNGIKILVDYFDPFFRPFATININNYSITVGIIEVVNKNGTTKNVINMAVRFGSTDDTHVCSKFRTFFHTIANRETLFSVSKDILEIPQQRKDFGISDVPEQFSLHWARTIGQNEAMQGNEKEKTFKFYDKVRGCNDMYPFYNNNAKKILSEEFTKVVKKYNDSCEQREKRERERREEHERKQKEQKELEKNPDYKKPVKNVQRNELWTTIDEHGNRITGAEMIRRQASLNLTNVSSNVDFNGQENLDIKNRQNIEFKDHQKSVFGQKSIQKKRQDVRNNEVEIVESQKEELKTVFKTRRIKDKIVEDGWTKIVYHNKEILVNLKQESHERLNKTPIENRGGGFKTPGRFDQRDKRETKKNNRNSSGNHGNYHRNTPVTHSGMSNRSNKTFSQGSTPNNQVYYNQRNPSASPSLTKRSGPAVGAASPGGESPHYLQLDRNLFNVNSSSGNLAFYHNQPSSPVISSTQQSENFLPPSGVFDMGRSQSPSIGSERSTPHYSSMREQQTFDVEVLDTKDW